MSSIVSRISRYAMVIVPIAAVLYQLASTQYVFVDPYQHQSIHLMLVLVLMFLLAIRTKPRFWPIWLLFIV